MNWVMRPLGSILTTGPVAELGDKLRGMAQDIQTA